MFSLALMPAALVLNPALGSHDPFVQAARYENAAPYAQAQSEPERAPAPECRNEKGEYDRSIPGCGLNQQQQEETQPVPAQPGMNKQQSMISVASKFHTEMTDAELARHQSAEDEARLKFQEEIRKEQK